MQRIKSQSISQIPSHTAPSNSRARSKKAPKSNVVESNINEKSRNFIAHTQNSLASIKTNSKTVTGSMKNLKVNHQPQVSGKVSTQNTSRAGMHNNSAISARILKQIIGYSNRGNSKPKLHNKSRQFIQNQKQRTVHIDLTNQYEQQCLNKSHKKQQKQDQPRTTLSEHRSKSKSNSSNSKTKNQNTKNRHNVKNHRVVQQFSPMSLSPEKQKQSKVIKNQLTQQDKKYSFFKQQTQELFCDGHNPKNQHPLNLVQQLQINLIKSSDQFLPHEGKSRLVYHNQVPALNFQTWKDYSAINQLNTEQKQNKRLQFSNINFKQAKFLQNNMTSPNISHILQHSIINNKSPTQHQNISTLALQEKRRLNIKNTMKTQNVKDQINVKSIQFSISESIPEVKTNPQKYNSYPEFTKLIEQKQRLIICLQQSSTLLDQHFQFNYKQLIPIWSNLIQDQKRSQNLQQKLLQMENNLKNELTRDHQKKTELFQVTRDQICRKKQKQYVTKSGKQRYLHQAVTCQQGLKLKLSSKADYQHVILFNQKVVLTGQNPIQDLYQLFTQLFENKLSKKFALIAKKQLANLSVYDSRLVQDFLKKVQQLQNNYTKIEGHHTSHNGNLSHNYSTSTQQTKLEQLVEQIQQITLGIDFMTNNIKNLKYQISKIGESVQQLNIKIEQYIKSVNRKVSGQYKMVEGCSFDFQLLLQQKYMKQFESYRKQIIARDQLIQKLNQIQRRLNIRNAQHKSRQNDTRQDYYVQKQSCNVQKSNYSTVRERSNMNQLMYKQSSRRNSATFVQSPSSHRVELKIGNYSNPKNGYKNGSYINFQQSRMEIQTKSHLDNMFKKSAAFHF